MSEGIGHPVNPTYEIAHWLSTHGGLPEKYTESFDKAIQIFHKEGDLRLPDVEDDGGKPVKLKATESNVDNEPIADIPSNITEARTKIEEYDQELLSDIERLKERISKAEEIQKDFMRSTGTPDKVIEEVARKQRNDGSPISFDGSSEDMFRIQAFLTDMVPVYKEFPFR